MNDQRAPVRIEQVLQREAICRKSCLRGPVGIDQQNWQITGVIIVDLSRKCEVSTRRGKRRRTLADRMDVKAVKSGWKIIDTHPYTYNSVALSVKFTVPTA